MNGRRTLIYVLVIMGLTLSAVAAHALPINPWNMTSGPTVLATVTTVTDALPVSSADLQQADTDTDTLSRAQTPFGAAEPAILLLLGGGLIALASMGRMAERNGAVRMMAKK